MVPATTLNDEDLWRCLTVAAICQPHSRIADRPTMAVQGKRKSRQQGSQFRSRQRAKAMAVALGIAMVITLGLLLLVNTSSDSRVEGEADHVTRHVLSLLLDPSTHGHGIAMEEQVRRSLGKPVTLEAQGRRSIKSKSQGAAIEAQGQHTGTRVIGVTVMMQPSSTSSPGAAMEAVPLNYEKRSDSNNWKPGADVVANAEAKAVEAVATALRAEERAEVAEAAAEMSIITQVGTMVAEGQSGADISILGEFEDSDDGEDSKEAKTKKDRLW